MEKEPQTNKENVRYERKRWSLSSDLEEMKAREKYLNNSILYGTTEEAELFPEAENYREEFNALKARKSTISGKEFRIASKAIKKKYDGYLTRLHEVYMEQNELTAFLSLLKDNKQKEDEVAARTEKKQLLDKKYNGFLKDKEMLFATATDTVLGRRVDFDKEGVMTRAEFIEKHYAAGDLSFEMKNMIGHPKRWNIMTEYEQYMWEKKHKPTLHYIINGHFFGKTAFEYAKYLSELKQNKNE